MASINKTKKRKLTIIIIAAILFIIIAGVIALSKMWNASSSDPASATVNVTPSPAVTTPPEISPSPTISPIPAESKDNYIGLYPAYKVSDGLKKYGFIDRTGTFVIEPIYDSAENFSNGLAIVTKDSTYKVIAPDGSVVFENDNTIASFHNGLAAYINIINNTYLNGYIDTKGNIIIEPQFLTAGDFNEDGMAYVMKPGEIYQLIDKTGAVIESYEPNVNSSNVISYKDGYLIYYDPDTLKYGVRTVRSETILEPIYSDISYLGYNLFAVKDPLLEFYEAASKPAALFNAQGEQLTEYVLYDLHSFDGEYTSAADETSIYFLGKDGKEVTSLPSFEGGGKLTLLGETIKAEIDSELIYVKKDNTILWQSDTSIQLSPTLKVNRVKFKPLRTVLVYYPKVEGIADTNVQDQINERLEEIFTEYRLTITEEDMLTVNDSFHAQLFHNLLVISMTGYDYYSGAAHGMPLWVHYFIDTETGAFYDFKDLFIAGSDYQSKINEIIRTRMNNESEKEGSMYFPETFTGIANDPNFYLTDESLIVYFTPYEIAAYAAGFPEFDIPFSNLDDYINKDGAFWKAFRQNEIK